MTLVPVKPPMSGETLRLLAVHAHPDDESSKGAASTAMYVANGVDVLVVSCTGGERGSILNPNVSLDGRDLGAIRRDEMARAAAVLGIRHHWLGFEDSGFPEGDPLPPLPEGCFASLELEEVAAPLVDLVRDFRPHVITTYDENGGYPHPDHIRAHEATMYAWERAADPTYESGQQPWAAAKLYYNHTFSRSRVAALHAAMQELGVETEYSQWLDGWDEADDSYRRVTTRVVCDAHFTQRDDALRAHATQIDPNSAWFCVPREVEARVWPTEDYELAYSRIGEVHHESDLFAGLRAV